LKAARFKLLLAEAKLEPRTLSPKHKKIIAEKVGTLITKNVNFVVQQNDKARVFASSIQTALKECGVPLGPLPYKMPPGENFFSAVVLHCPNEGAVADDPLYKALVACGIRVGTTSLTTLSLEIPTPTPLDIGKVFPMIPTGSSLPDDEYILWVGEQSAFDDQAELVRRVEEAFGPIAPEQ